MIIVPIFFYYSTLESNDFFIYLQHISYCFFNRAIISSNPLHPTLEMRLLKRKKLPNDPALLDFLNAIPDSRN